MAEWPADKAFKAVLAWWDDVGVDVPPIKPAKRKPMMAPKTLNPSRVAPPSAATSPKPQKSTPKKTHSESTAIASACKTLDELRAAIESFDAGALSDNARQAVFSRGNPDADIMVIGEAPGADEDRAGKPFVGRSGQLLDKIFASIGLTEDDLYLTNIVNWRPPKNRNPSTDEIALCRPFITRHIALKKPKLICIVGGVSMKTLTNKTAITRARGEWVEVNAETHKSPAIILYHPAYLLRQPHLKRDMWRDMLSLRTRIESL